MTIVQVAPASPDALLDAIDDAVRDLQDGGLEPRFVVLGPAAYARLCEGIAARYGRSAGAFESYQYLTLVVDPFRGDDVCVLPVPREARDLTAERR